MSAVELDLPWFYFPVFGAVLGLVIGSFLATIIVRWPQGRSALGGRSRCDSCDAVLQPWQLMPLLGFVLQNGKCTQCGADIAPVHFWIELTAAVVGGAALFISPDIAGFAGAIFGWFLVALTALDTEHRWLPDKLVLPMAAAGLVAGLVIDEPSLRHRLIGGVAGFASLYAIALGYKALRGKEGLGGGDPKMLGAIGMWTGWVALPIILMLACGTGLLLLLGRRLRGEKIARDEEIPLGSLLAIAAFPVWLYQSANGGLFN